MTNCPQSTALLRRVGTRIYLARIAKSLYLSFIVLSAIVLMGALFVRLTGLIPQTDADAWIRYSLLAVPGLAVLGAIALTRRPQSVDAARQVDTVCDTHDLFLTVTKIGQTAGEYQPLVTRDAEDTAKKIDPVKVVNLDPTAYPQCGRRAGNSLLLATLAVAAYFLPTLDPFEKQLEAKEQHKVLTELKNSEKQTEIRKQALVDKNSDSEVSEEVAVSLDKLAKDLKQMQKAQPVKNEQKLNENQKSLGEQSRALKTALKDLKQNLESNQQFGQENADEMRKMLDGLQQGRPDEMNKKMDAMKENLERLMKEEDPLKRSEMVQQLKKDLDQMSKLAGKKAGNKGMQAALERALDQIEKSGMKSDMASEALDAAKESLELAKMELKEMAQSARDLESLEQALEAIAKAKKLNSEGQLDGEMGADATTLEDYQQLYDQIMAQMGGDGMEGEGEGEGEGDGNGEGEGDGNGLGGQGMGRGSKAPEDESSKTAFQSEKTKTALKKGKILLSLKTKDAPTADAKDLQAEYREIISSIKQATEEAIEREEAPPGYHDGIKKYFDTLERLEENQAKPVEPATP